MRGICCYRRVEVFYRHGFWEYRFLIAWGMQVWELFVVMRPGGIFCHGAWRCLLLWSLEIW